MSDRTRQHFIPSSLLEIMIINFTAYLPNCAKHHFQADRPKIYTSPKYIFLISSWVIPISHCKDSDYDLHVRALIQTHTCMFCCCCCCFYLRGNNARRFSRHSTPLNPEANGRIHPRLQKPEQRQELRRRARTTTTGISTATTARWKRRARRAEERSLSTLAQQSNRERR